MIVAIDNYDSFTYNLVQYLRQMGAEVQVARSDALAVRQIRDLSPSGIIISPGPGRPEVAGISMEAVRRFSGRVPILGVCLGHQAVGAVFGAHIVPAGRLMHGKTSEVTCDGRTIFNRIPSPFTAMRYHSLAVSHEGLPAELEISAWSEDGEIMGIRHREHPTEGIQFHPESIMTAVGKRILRNFLKITRQEKKAA